MASRRTVAPHRLRSIVTTSLHSDNPRPRHPDGGRAFGLMVGGGGGQAGDGVLRGACRLAPWINSEQIKRPLHRHYQTLYRHPSARSGG
ncbi:hypothetical protein E2562_027675 [Oryza meyeriana var. granulata]|uniref:Uncharacterized protein n=1 Tax=Oryza meyeriana var. granulata TaxID=110450 RepID=A0A6G1EQK8_9ORYZ|nr:hypothetical protein E2562_027675 [Oryza meyeriana var. granulata]